MVQSMLIGKYKSRRQNDVTLWFPNPANVFNKAHHAFVSPGQIPTQLPTQNDTQSTTNNVNITTNMHFLVLKTEELQNQNEYQNINALNNWIKHFLCV